MNVRLQMSGYLAAEADFTLADLNFLSYFEMFAPAGLADAIESRPALAAWWTRCRTRPAWKYTISGKVLEDKKMAEDPLGRPRPWER
jgi:glutathione S-transferase